MFSTDYYSLTTLHTSKQKPIAKPKNKTHPHVADIKYTLAQRTNVKLSYSLGPNTDTQNFLFL